MTTQISNEKLNNKPEPQSYNWLFAIYVVLTMAIYILPAAKLRVPYAIAGSLMLVSLPLLMIKDNKWFVLSLGLVLSSIVFLIFNMLHGVGVVDAINDVIRNVRFFLPALWAMYSINNVGEKQKKFIFWLFIAISGYILLNTLVALEQNPWIARILAQEQSTSTGEVNQYRLNNVGGYQYSYMMGAVALLFTWAIFICEKRIYKFICVMATVLCFYYIIQTMYTTLLLLVAVGIVIICLIKSKSLIIKITTVFIAIVAIFFLPQMIEFVSGFFAPDSLLKVKFQQIYDSLTGKGIEALGSRPQLIEQALENWSKTPLFGAHYDTPSHSAIFEYLQQNGLFGLGLWLTMFIVAWHSVAVSLKKANVNIDLFNVICAYLIVLSIFNDTKYTFEITIAVFFVTAVFSSLFCKKQTK